MRKRIAILTLMACMASSVSFAQWKIMSYNIRGGRGMDGVCSYQRIADAILRELPDVVAVQEIDSVTGRSNGKYVLGEVATLTGMHDTFAPAINFDGGKYGIGILSREKPRKATAHPLPGSEEARVILVAEFKKYVLCCTHLSLTEADRKASLSLIKELAKGTRKPFFLAGDFNDEPASPFIQTLQQDFVILSDLNAPTFPASDPENTIDYITAYKKTARKLKVTSQRVANEPVASDHRPIVVELR